MRDELNVVSQVPVFSVPIYNHSDRLARCGVGRCEVARASSSGSRRIRFVVIIFAVAPVTAAYAHKGKQPFVLRDKLLSRVTILRDRLDGAKGINDDVWLVAVEKNQQDRQCLKFNCEPASVVVTMRVRKHARLLARARVHARKLGTSDAPLLHNFKYRGTVDAPASLSLQLWRGTLAGVGRQCFQS